MYLFSHPLSGRLHCFGGSNDNDWAGGTAYNYVHIYEP
jgi:hypothetical protein